MWKIQNENLCAGLLAAVWLTGCAHGQRSQIDAMERALHQAAPQPEETEAANALLESEHAGPLEKKQLVEAVLARNPSLESARLAWQAVVAQQPQATALSDPMVSYSLAPASIGSNVVRFGQVVKVEQRFPWPSKLGLAGDVVLSDAEAAQADYEAVRLDLALLASLLFDEYAKVVRLLELNVEHRELTEDIKAAAMAQYEAGRAPQQEPLQAEVELSHVLHEQVLLEADRSVIIAKLNQLLHRAPQAPLPKPARVRFVPADIAETTELQDQALEERPELRATDARIGARESAAELTQREFFPDLGIMGEYNSMWRETQHQWMLGVSLNLPIQIKSRRGAVDQANAELGRVRADLEVLSDEVRTEVDQSRQRVLEAQHVLVLYQNRLLPAARAQIQAARAGYQTGRNSFQALVDSERSLRTLEIQYEQALATFGQRGAELSRALGEMPGLPKGETP
ncbi:MAG: TolC family protein [Myxococcales bacterium]|nr:TolC family protein [Myxococcales bacterium]MDH3842956.1 TolC family protein [Myxococcales bacterium]